MWNELFKTSYDVTSALTEVIKKASTPEEAVDAVKSTLDSILDIEKRELEFIRRAIYHEEMDMIASEKRKNRRLNLMLLLCNLLVSVFVLFVAFAAL